MDKKILITGTHGFVGARTLEKYKTAIPIPSELVRIPNKDLEEFIKKQNPDIIINSAAISDIGACEKDPDASYIANVTLPVTLAKVSKETGAKLVSFSSDQVYTGCTNDAPYSENDTLPTPANVYARHKLEAENRVLDINPDSVLLRATWMYDMPIFNHANRGNFLVNILKNIISRKQITASSLTYRGITYVRQVVDLTDKLFDIAGGVYNYGSENPLDMYATTKELFFALGYSDLCSQLITDDKSQRHNLWMDCKKIKSHGIFFDTTADGFKRCIKDYALNK